MTDTNVLGHLETGNLLVATLNARGVTVVGADNAALGFLNASLAETIVTPGSLVTTESDTSDVSTVVNGGKFSKGTPAAAKVEHLVTGLNSNLLTDDSQLVILELFKSLFLVDVADDTRGVDHTRAEEPSVEVITSVVVVTDLLLVYIIPKSVRPSTTQVAGEKGFFYKARHTLRTSVHQHLGNEAKQEVLEETHSELEVGPVMTVL